MSNNTIKIIINIGGPRDIINIGGPRASARHKIETPATTVNGCKPPNTTKNIPTPHNTKALDPPPRPTQDSRNK